MNLPRLHTTVAVVSVVAAGLLVAACGGGDDLNDRTDTTPPQLRLIHAAAAAPAVTLYRNGTADAPSTNVSYKGFSSYHDTTFGANALVLRPASASSTDLSSATIDAQRGRKYTAVAVPDNLVSAQLLMIDDPYTKPVGNDQARIRVVNASSNANAVDIYITAPNAALTSLAPNFAGLQYRTVLPTSGNDATEFSNGTYQVRITSVGSKTPIFSNTITLAKNDDMVLITVPTDAVGLAADDIRLLLVKADDPGRTATELATQ